MIRRRTPSRVSLLKWKVNEAGLIPDRQGVVQICTIGTNAMKAKGSGMGKMTGGWWSGSGVSAGVGGTSGTMVVVLVVDRVDVVVAY
jgi:hypothetical protein